jgi:uncharacterized membrane protein
MTPLSALNVTIGLTLVSLFLSLYMTLTHYVAGELPQWCSFGSFFSCADLLRSEWALLLRAPIALLGLAWNVVLLGIATHARDLVLAAPRLDDATRQWLAVVRAWLTTGVLFVFYLLAVELYLGKICLLCTGVHIATLLAAWAMRPHADWRPHSLRPFFVPVALAMLVMAAPVVWSNADLLSGAASGAKSRNPRSRLALVDCLIAQKVEIVAHERCAVCRLQTTFFDRANEIFRIVDMSKQQEAQFTEPLWMLDGNRVHQGLLTVDDIKLKFKC